MVSRETSLLEMKRVEMTVNGGGVILGCLGSVNADHVTGTDDGRACIKYL